jgi:hypothetical protein
VKSHLGSVQVAAVAPAASETAGFSRARIAVVRSPATVVSLLVMSIVVDVRSDSGGGAVSSGLVLEGICANAGGG